MKLEENKNMENFYFQSLDVKIIEYLSEILKIEKFAALEIYYKSKLCDQIHKGENNIQYLDFKNLVEDLIENESELFKKL